MMSFTGHSKFLRGGHVSQHGHLFGISTPIFLIFPSHKRGGSTVTGRIAFLALREI